MKHKKNTVVVNRVGYNIDYIIGMSEKDFVSKRMDKDFQDKDKPGREKALKSVYDKAWKLSGMDKSKDSIPIVETTKK